MNKMKIVMIDENILEVDNVYKVEVKDYKDLYDKLVIIIESRELEDESWRENISNYIGNGSRLLSDEEIMNEVLENNFEDDSFNVKFFEEEVFLCIREDRFDDLSDDDYLEMYEENSIRLKNK